MWRGGALALCVVFVLSTQLLFQVNLYRYWPVSVVFLGWLDSLLAQLTVGISILAAVGLTVAIPVNSIWRRYLLVVAAIALGAVVGESLNMLSMELPADVSTTAVLFAKNPRWLIIGLLTYALFVLRRQAELASTLVHENELKSAEIDLQITQARLQFARAYIEPHFLFNTLANLQRLWRTAPESSRAMLKNFIAYMRAALPGMQDDRTNLGQDVEIARAYLAMLQVRMGSRLRYDFDIPEPLLALPFPPLALSTLVENAIKHGLNPLPEGGRILVTARVTGGRLRVDVVDTGAGLCSPDGTGTGLTNLRARLRAQYGAEASVALRASAPRGIQATILIPVGPTSDGHPKFVSGVIAAIDGDAWPLRFWSKRIVQGIALGSMIAILDLLYYAPLLRMPIEAELHLAVRSIVLWSGECMLFALMLGGVERVFHPKEFRAVQLAVAAVVCIAVSVVAWHAFAIIVLRDCLGVDLFREQVAASGNWVGDMLYHAWLMLFFGGLVLAVGTSQRRRARAQAALRATELGRMRSQQSLAKAKLERLKAGVDPSHLFEALARLETLYAENSSAADALLDEIIAFLRDVLTQARVYIDEGGQAK